VSRETNHTPARTRREQSQASDADGLRRARIIDALTAVVAEEGYEGASVTAICARAKVSRDAFYATFESREQCFLAMMDDGIGRARELIEREFEAHERWFDGVQAALATLLCFFDSQPALACAWLIGTLGAGPWALERRERHIAALTESIVARWSPPPGVEAHPRAAESVMAAVLGMIQSHLLAKRPQPLVSLLGPLMGVASAPYLQASAVGEGVERGDALAEAILAGGAPPRQAVDAIELPETLRDPRARRARRCIVYLAAHPQASNREIADAIGVSSHTQTSTLLARLMGMGLLLKRAGRPGHPNSWSLSAHGWQIAAAIQRSVESFTESSTHVGVTHHGREAVTV
jgi:AcrR family transcriptional regulator